jgi:hypothetical protein
VHEFSRFLESKSTMQPTSKKQKHSKTLQFKSNKLSERITIFICTCKHPFLKVKTCEPASQFDFNLKLGVALPQPLPVIIIKNQSLSSANHPHTAVRGSKRKQHKQTDQTNNHQR